MRKASYFLVAMLVLASTPARAEAWDFKAGLGPVYGTTFSSADKDGVGFAVYADLGLTETLWLSAGGGYAVHSIGVGRSYSLEHLSLGLLYNIDVLVVVPFVSLRLGWLASRPEGRPADAGLGLSVDLGFDYLWTDYFTVGLAVNYHGMLTDLNAFPGYVAFTGRVGFRLPY